MDRYYANLLKLTDKATGSKSDGVVKADTKYKTAKAG